MIVYDLICGNDHVFESWFKDSKAFESQAKRGLLSCPICQDSKIEKALMAPAVNTSRQREAREDADRKKMVTTKAMAMLAEVRKQVEDNCDYVGGDFADTALKMHFGEEERRDIYGEATEDETEELREEGVEFAQIPWLPRGEN